MSRPTPWRRVCPDLIRDRVEEAKNTRLLFVSRSGPTGFVVKDPALNKKYKVLLGGMSTCSCPQFRKENELCIHILWVLVRKLRVPETNPILWQRSLIDREVQELLRGSAALPPPAATQATKSNAANAKEDEPEVEQRPVSEDDVCPICQCELLNSEDSLVFCRRGCGQSVHGDCMYEWAKHAKSQGEAENIRCPLCRVSFGDFAHVRQLCLQPKSKRGAARQQREDVHLGHTCGKCKASPIEGELYSCRVCARFDLCQTCFVAGEHSQHNFTCKATPKAQPRTVDRAALPHALIERLQQRDLSDEDYDMLLLLDRPAAVTVADTDALDRDYPAFVVNSRHPLSRAANPATCEVCSQAIGQGATVRKLGCGHTFHKGCIDPYLTQQRNACPIDGLSVGAEARGDEAGVTSRQRSGRGPRRPQRSSRPQQPAPPTQPRGQRRRRRRWSSQTGGGQRTPSGPRDRIAANVEAGDRSASSAGPSLVVGNAAAHGDSDAPTARTQGRPVEVAARRSAAARARPQAMRSGRRTEAQAPLELQAVGVAGSTALRQQQQQQQRQREEVRGRQQHASDTIRSSHDPGSERTQLGPLQLQLQGARPRDEQHWVRQRQRQGHKRQQPEQQNHEQGEQTRGERLRGAATSAQGDTAGIAGLGVSGHAQLGSTASLSRQRPKGTQIRGRPAALANDLLDHRERAASASALSLSGAGVTADNAGLRAGFARSSAKQQRQRKQRHPRGGGGGGQQRRHGSAPVSRPTARPPTQLPPLEIRPAAEQHAQS